MASLGHNEFMAQQVNPSLNFNTSALNEHDDVIKWKHFPRNWPFVREIHRSPVNCPHKGQWRGALMFSLIYAWINDWVNNREAGDLRRQHGHYDVIVMNIRNRADGIFKYIILNENIHIIFKFYCRLFLQIQLCYVCVGSSNGRGAKQVTNHYLNQWRPLASSDRNVRACFTITLCGKYLVVLWSVAPVTNIITPGMEK